MNMQNESIPSGGDSTPLFHVEEKEQKQRRLRLVEQKVADQLALCFRTAWREAGNFAQAQFERDLYSTTNNNSPTKTLLQLITADVIKTLEQKGARSLKRKSCPGKKQKKSQSDDESGEDIAGGESRDREAEEAAEKDDVPSQADLDFVVDDLPKADGKSNDDENDEDSRTGEKKQTKDAHVTAKDLAEGTEEESNDHAMWSRAKRQKVSSRSVDGSQEESAETTKKKKRRISDADFDE